MDTGVLVSAFAFGGTPREAVRKAVAEDMIFVSPDLLKEYREVPAALAKRRKIDNRQFMALIAGIAAVVANAGLVHPKKRLEICRDPKDDMLLECCLAAKADLLVTGDLDLLSITDLPFAVGIVTPADYLAAKDRKR
ncbi:MAG: putative toxin-antitoxin system toxin component, PIN family [Deltaproteobacteria bacterium CG2_30_66_27]|nr:MAG: putative toxin-antitoxin system toxin component, PIN family [Deltaproteobacteria bacterium CG2_30_66_27]PJB30714.1 MAG: putative toxin-antitoxin system toxin component, PIN family [Deltaproteobacteria bacterium CG_4_9_14_3_um_filter_65_9]